jgi:hypothetical protein
LQQGVNSVIKVNVNTIKVIKNSLKSVQFSELSKTGQRFRKLDGWQRFIRFKAGDSSLQPNTYAGDWRKSRKAGDSSVKLEGWHP